MAESFLLEFLLYLVTGAFVGLAAGLLGIGGGLIIVPVLATGLTFFIDSEQIVHIAIGTSLATILVTSLASAYVHHQHGAVRWDIFRMLAVGVLAGAFVGGWLSQFIASATLANMFGILGVLIAINMLLALKPKPTRQLPGLAGNTAAGTVIGSLSSIVGIGGGTFTTPYQVWNNVSMHQAVATSAAVSLPVAFAGSIGYVLAGLQATDLPAYTTGYIYWPAFLGIVLASVFTAPMGAKLAHQLPVKALKRAFGVFLLLFSAKMLFFTH